ncbi:hypothetical protein SI65_00704 [Aspergillus cristatus]|uniref:Cytochrome P450 n=1 Tax=Aspergillus cristatus TaxID=573508 RepID=A0A1E3BQ84_ASPCR|nr:hypothetical protein SI65_00704 [Aspergillus cristatus]
MHYVIQDMHRQYGDVGHGRYPSAVHPLSALYMDLQPDAESRPGMIKALRKATESLELAYVTPRHIMNGVAFGIADSGSKPKALNEYEPHIVAKARMLVSKINERHAQPLNITNWISCYAFDVMDDIALEMEFGMLKHGQKPAEVKKLQSKINVVAVDGTIPLLAPLVMDIPGLMPLINPFRQLCHLLLEERQQSVSKDEYPKDIISWLIQEKENGDPGAAPSKRALQDDAWTLVVAGSDMVSITLTNTSFYLSTHYSVLSKLQYELDQVFPRGMQDWSYERVKNIKYLDYINNEALRLKPLVPGSLTRVNAARGLANRRHAYPGWYDHLRSHVHDPAR